MADIFLSYSKEDLPVARSISPWFTQMGWSVWWDRKIPAGKMFDEVIAHELKTARCVVVLWTQRSIQSNWVKEEAAEARDRRVLVPVVLDDIEIPLGFRRVQAADLRGWRGDLGDDRLSDLKDAVAECLRSNALCTDRTAAATDIKELEEAKEMPRKPAVVASERELRMLARQFFDTPLEVRQAAAASVSRLALDVPFERILLLTESTVPGERVAAAIAMAAHLDSNPSLATAEQVVRAVESGLDDARSRVRYRYVELLWETPSLAMRFKLQLERLLMEDSNSAIQAMARAALARIQTRA